MKPVILLLSGGVDSVTLGHELKRDNCLVHALSFDYGQTHIKELRWSRYHAQRLGFKQTIVELHKIQGLFRKSALTDGDGGVIVPNRNSVFVHIAASIAVTAGAESVIIGCNKDDATEFPDCRWDWLEAINATLKASETEVEVCAPYIGLTKWQIIHRAKQLGVDIAKTWSCYKDGEKPCGRCLACRKMREACA